MNNVYIGERYVPIVYGPWDGSKDYESLIIVTSDGSGYISKKAVPKGTPISNTEYWALLYQGGAGGSVVTWESIIGKPTSFPSSWDSITGKPTNFPVSWESVSGKPSAFPSTWNDVSEKPDLFPSDWGKISNRPTLFNTSWELIQDKPETFPTNWASISNKPKTFTPSPHTHKQADIDGLETSLNDIQAELNEHTESITELVNELNTWSDLIDNKADKSLENVSDTDFYNKGIASGLGGGSTSVSWDSITDKPLAFPPSAHTHSINEITNLAQTLAEINSAIIGIQSSITGIDTALNNFNTRLTNTQNTVGQQTVSISNLQSNQNAFNTQLQNLSNSLTTKANATLDNVDNETFKAKATEAGIGGGSADVNWDDVLNKPETFPPSSHTHPISQVEELETALDAKMSAPDSDGATGNVLMYSAQNKGKWGNIPAATYTANGLLTGDRCLKIDAINRYVSLFGTYGKFEYRRWSDGFVEAWIKISISSLSVSTALGGMYRSQSPYNQNAYKYPVTFSENPYVFATFYTTNSSSALVWLNPVSTYSKTYLPPLYLLRPTSGTVSGELYFYVCGHT